jgi:D-glycero-alpha-D-manno-heptose-7-phosphate kinase
MLLLYTGVTRKAGPILRRARAKFKSHDGVLKRMRRIAELTRQELQQGKVDSLGELLHEGWVLKRGLATGVSNPAIDQAYELARKHGAAGGKILGAGGGGFLLLFCAPEQRERVRRALSGWRQIAFQFEPEGSKIVYVSK